MFKKFDKNMYYVFPWSITLSIGEKRFSVLYFFLKIDDTEIPHRSRLSVIHNQNTVIIPVKVFFGQLEKRPANRFLLLGEM